MPALRWRWCRQLDPFHELKWRQPTATMVRQFNAAQSLTKVGDRQYLVVVTAQVVQPELWLVSNREEVPNGL